MSETEKRYQNRIHGVDPEHGLELLCEGTFERFVTVGKKKRRILVYVPAGARPSCAGVFVLGENGLTADDLLQNSLWREMADNDRTREKFIVFFLEPLEGVWHTEEAYGDPAGDVAYVDAAYLDGCSRDLFCVHESKFYLAGCREGGVIANMEAMYHPTVWAGVCTVGGTKVSGQYMSAAEKDICVDLDGFEDEDHRIRLRKGDVPVPAMIFGDADNEDSMETLAAYWKKAAGITENGKTDERGVCEYVRTAEPPYPGNQEKEAYRVQTRICRDAGADFGNVWLEEIRSFLFAQRRWMGDPGGTLKVTRDPVEDIGMQYCTEVIDGWRREWYIYEPESARHRNGKKIPLVFAMHGYSCSGEIYAGDSCWHKVADRYGFLLVHPSGTLGSLRMETKATSAENIPLTAWNVMHGEGPDENHFFRHMLARISEEYPVDESRVYITGHSYGSMMTQWLALTETELFAAAAPCSGVFFDAKALDIRTLPEVAVRPGESEIPVWMFTGEYEAWLFPHIPKEDNITGDSILFWQKRDHLQEELPAENDDRWIRKDRWNDLVFTNDEGIPMVRYTWVSDMPHATTEEMSFRIWEEFFSRLSRTDGKVRMDAV